MKRVLFLLLLVCQSLQANPAAPSLTVSNLQHGRVVSRFPNPESPFGTKEITRVAAIRVRLSAFSKPAHPYEVQCFFFAKDPAKRRYVYDVQRFHSDGKLADFAVYARNLFGGSETLNQFTRYETVSEQTADGRFITRTIPVTEIQKSKTAGSTREGWAVRVLSEGKVVRSAASVAQLQAFLEKEAAHLDELASEAPIQKTEPAP